MNVGCINVFSTFSSNTRFIIFPIVFSDSESSISNSFAIFIASSSVSTFSKSIPVTFLIESFIVILLNLSKFIVWSSYTISVVPFTF